MTVPTAEVIERAGGEARDVDADVTQAADLERLVAAAVDLGGRLDVLVNNAGIVGGSSLLRRATRNGKSISTPI